jgi:hypothetical protein
MAYMNPSAHFDVALEQYREGPPAIPHPLVELIDLRAAIEKIRGMNARFQNMAPELRDDTGSPSARRPPEIDYWSQALTSAISER